MTRLTCCFWAVLALLALAPAADGLEIRFKPAAVVKGDLVTFGDIAVVLPDSAAAQKLAAEVVQRAVAPGARLVLKTADVKKSLIAKDPGLADAAWSGSQKTEVARAALLIDERRIGQILDDFIGGQKTYFPEAELRIKNINAPPAFYLPEGALDVEVIPADPAILRSRRFTLIFRVDGRVEKNIAIPGEVEALALVVVAGKDLKRGTMIGPHDIVLGKIDLTEAGNPLFEPEEAIGKEVKRLIRRGKPLERGLVEAPPVIRRGELVTIAARKGPLTVTAKGIARDDGKAGALITVSNSSSKKEILCKVDAPGLVVVEF